jgi:hypothetical protein
VSLFGNEIVIVSVNTKIKWCHKLVDLLFYIYIYIYIYIYVCVCVCVCVCVYVCVCVCNKLSKWDIINTGVLQGLVLGPLFSLIYINDLPSIIPCTLSVLYLYII